MSYSQIGRVIVMILIVKIILAIIIIAFVIMSIGWAVGLHQFSEHVSKCKEKGKDPFTTERGDYGEDDK